MSSVAVRIPEKTHARLRQLAEGRQETVGHIITELLNELEERRFWAEAERSVAAAMADPEIQREMEEEQRIYDGALMDGLEPETWPDQ